MVSPGAVRSRKTNINAQRINATEGHLMNNQSKVTNFRSSGDVMLA